MDMRELRAKLAKLASGDIDSEGDHIKADKLLLKYIGDRIVTKHFRKIDKWYS